MNEKVRIKFAGLSAVGCGLALFVGGMIVDVFPNNPYKGVIWMIMLPTIIYYTQGNPVKKDIINMICSFAVGLVWGFLSGLPTMALKMAGEVPFAFIEYGLVTTFVIFVHGGLLANTVFNKPTCAFLGVALSVASSTTFFSTGNFSMETMSMIPISEPWNQIDLFIIFVIGCAILFLEEVLGGMLCGLYAKKMKQAGVNQELEE